MVERAIGARHADASTYTCARTSASSCDPAGAVRCADIALTADVNNPHARAMRGEALVRLGTVDKGIAELDAANAAAPADAELWRRSGRVLLGLNRGAEALRATPAARAPAARRRRGGSPARRSTSRKGARPRATIALSLVGNFGEESRGQYVIGRIALKQEKPEAAVIAFARATRLDAKQGAAWAGLAEGYLALKDDRKARDALASAAALPDAPPAVFRASPRSRSAATAPPAALPALEKAVARPAERRRAAPHPDPTLAHVERWHDAANAAREAQRLSPKSIDALVLGAKATAMGKNGEAIETLSACARPRVVRRALQARPQLCRQQPLQRRAVAPRGAPAALDDRAERTRT